MNSLLSKNKKLLLVLNPVSGLGKGKKILFDTVNRFTLHGYAVTVLPTLPDRRETAKGIAALAVSHDKVVAVGGDGTLNIVVGALLEAGIDVPLGYIPLGSTNDFAASLALPKDVTECIDRIAEYAPKNIDVGRFCGEYFVYIACTGLFTEASYMTSQQLKNTLGPSAYVWNAIAKLKDTKSMKYTVNADGEIIKGDFLFVSVSNTLRAGGVIKIPKKDIRFDDGLFELTLVKTPEKLYGLTSLINDLIKSDLDSDCFIRRKVSSATITLETASGWSLDGENGGMARCAEVEVLKKAIRLIY